MTTWKKGMSIRAGILLLVVGVSFFGFAHSASAAAIKLDPGQTWKSAPHVGVRTDGPVIAAGKAPPGTTVTWLANTRQVQVAVPANVPQGPWNFEVSTEYWIKPPEGQPYLETVSFSFTVP